MISAVVYVKIRFFFGVTPCILVDMCWCLGETYSPLQERPDIRRCRGSRQQTFLPWIRRQQVNSKRQNISNKPHGITFQKTIIHEHKFLNPLNAELNPICYLLALLKAHHFLYVSRIRVKSLILSLLMSYTYGAPILDVSKSHTTTHHGR